MPRGRRLDPAKIRDLVGPPAGIPTDADLLARFVVDRDPAAFELLLRRHAALVFGTCRRILVDPNDADDAFQATFLVLARKARSVARTERLSHWLYRVAGRAALRVRSARERRARREQGGLVDQPTTPAVGGDRPELARVLDEEVGRLPARHRAAFVLCCLEGKTGAEAAAILGCPPGTVSSRLTRARVRLRDRLARRGIVPAALVAVSVPREAPAVLIDVTLQTSLGLAAAARPAAIATGVTRAMLLNKVRFVPLVVAGLLAAGVTLVGTGAGPVPPARAGDAPPKDKEPAPPTVTLVRVRPGGLERVAQPTCAVEPAGQADLYPAVAGQVTSVAVDLGDRVKAGQVLAEIDAPDLVLAERQAEAAVEQATGLLKAAEAGAAVARADVVTAESTVLQQMAELAGAEAGLKARQIQLDRLKRLQSTGQRSASELEEPQVQAVVAKSQVEAGTARVEKAKAELGVKKAKVAQAEAAAATERANVEAAKVGLERARLAVARTKVRAPFDGVVTRREGLVGEAVRADPAPGRPLFTVVRADVVRVVVRLPERYLAVTRPGAPAELTFEAVPGAPVSGKVSRVGFALEADRTIRAEIDIPNSGGDLRPGMVGWAKLRFGPGPAGAVRVPQGAAFRLPEDRVVGDARWGVYVYRDGKARLTPVRIDYQNDEEAEVRSGLKAGDVVLEDPRLLESLAGREEVSVVGVPPGDK